MSSGKRRRRKNDPDRHCHHHDKIRVSEPVEVAHTVLKETRVEVPVYIHTTDTVIRTIYLPGEETVDTHAVYDTVDIDGDVTKGTITDALVRIRYSQSAVEAIMRHALADAPGAQEEFEVFNAYAEWCKSQAERILEPET